MNTDHPECAESGAVRQRLLHAGSIYRLAGESSIAIRGGKSAARRVHDDGMPHG